MTEGPPSPSLTLPLLAPRDLAASFDTSSSSSRDRPLEGRRARLSHRSRAGCWTCRGRKVKCDEQHPRCGQCTRLDRTCDWNHRWNFNDATKNTKDRHTNVTTAGNVVWDPSVKSHHTATLSPLEGSLPPFSDLTNDEDRERLAESTTPGTYSVIVTPESFATLPEYTQTSIYDRRSSIRSSRGSLTRRPSKIDPNVVILDHFEESPSTVASPTSPIRRASLPESSIHNTYPQPAASNLLDCFRQHVVHRIIPQALDIGSSPLSRTATKDCFEIESTRFPPLFHAICAVSALHLDRPGHARSEEAINHYSQALAQPSSDEELRSDGSLLRHLLLLVYETSIPWELDQNMWTGHLAAIQHIVQTRSTLQVEEKHPYLIWLVCGIEMYAGLLGIGDCSFTRAMVNNKLLPSQILPRPRSGIRMTDDESLLSAVLELNKSIMIQTAKVAQAAHGFREDYTTNSRSPDMLNHFQAGVVQLQNELVGCWASLYPQTLGNSADAARYLPPRTRYFVENTTALFNAVMIYLRTSMFPGQRLITVPNQNNLVADIEVRVDLIQAIANNIIADQAWDQRHIIFPIFMAGYVTKQPESKVNAIAQIRAFEGTGIGQNTSLTRKLLTAVCEEQARSLNAGRPVEEVDWLRISIEQGLRFSGL